ncbi:hypothetical protein YC2023_053186 [Brassica napus]
MIANAQEKRKYCDEQQLPVNKNGLCVDSECQAKCREKRGAKAKISSMSPTPSLRRKDESLSSEHDPLPYASDKSTTSSPDVLLRHVHLKTDPDVFLRVRKRHRIWRAKLVFIVDGEYNSTLVTKFFDWHDEVEKEVFDKIVSLSENSSFWKFRAICNCVFVESFSDLGQTLDPSGKSSKILCAKSSDFTEDFMKSSVRRLTRKSSVITKLCPESQKKSGRLSADEANNKEVRPSQRALEAEWLTAVCATTTGRHFPRWLLDFQVKIN